MQDVLAGLVRGTPLEEQLQARLVQLGDPKSYSGRLVEQTLCAVNATAPTLRSRFTLQQHSSQAEVRFLGVSPTIACPCMHVSTCGLLHAA